MSEATQNAKPLVTDIQWMMRIPKDKFEEFIQPLLVSPERVGEIDFKKMTLTTVQVSEDQVMFIVADKVLINKERQKATQSQPPSPLRGV